MSFQPWKMEHASNLLTKLNQTEAVQWVRHCSVDNLITSHIIQKVHPPSFKVNRIHFPPFQVLIKKLQFPSLTSLTYQVHALVRCTVLLLRYHRLEMRFKPVKDAVDHVMVFILAICSLDLTSAYDNEVGRLKLACSRCSTALRNSSGLLWIFPDLGFYFF
jgi:hypothetical protein